jgi:hypothetical protein
MKSMATVRLALKKNAPGLVKPGFVKAASFVLVASALAMAQSSPQIQLPQVHLDAAGLAPRPIEELTGTTIARHYARAWRDLVGALESDRAEGLGEEFVGSAKDRLMRRIGEQKQASMHVRIVDRGHHLKAVFYSTDGTAMQLLDQAQLEIQTFDGNKLLDTQNAPHEYIVLMTPGADRWYVRDLEEVSAKPF